LFPGYTILAFSFYRYLLIAVFCMAAIAAKAQICTGSLGDPVVNINFNPGNTGNVPANGYIFTSGSCPNDGYYTVTNSSTGCFNGTWLNVTADHTGGGRFMLVNASFSPGDFFLTTVSDLCPNTTYEFAAWIMNVLQPRNGIKPNITFSIETPSGVVLQQYASGDIPETASPFWKQYGFYFTTPINNPIIVLRMTNNAPGGIGNDLALDDITFRPCGPALITAAIQGNADTVDVCEGSTDEFTFNGSLSVGYTQPVYQWQVSTNAGGSWADISGANGINYLRKPTVAGNYWYRLAVTEQSAISFTACRIASDIVAVNVHAKPLVNAGPDKVIFRGDSVTLNGTVDTDVPVYYWNPTLYLNNASLLNPSASPPSDMTYTLFGESAFGCPNNDEVKIRVIPGVFVPSAFTPNGDSKNDRWRIPYLDPLFGAVVNVFNRYGQLVYHTQGGIVDWDGNYGGLPQPSGAYVYHIRYKKNNGEASLKGTVILIR
jgi:gliding motility-associated-like protein